MTPAKWGEYNYFTRNEFTCRCCGQEHMKHEFLLLLDKVRLEYGRPLMVTSGYRCPDHNASVSSTGRTGPHTTGLAVDFGVSGGGAHELLTAAIQCNQFTGIGIHQCGPLHSRFIHLDILTTQPRPWVWTYG